MLLNDETTWEQFIEFQKVTSVFVEDSLSSMALCLNMDEELITFEVSEVFDYNADVVTLEFRKAASKKKVSLYSEFKRVYGEYLEPRGFKLVKSKHPYFVRVLNNEVIQLVSIKKEKDEFADIKNQKNCKINECFEIYAGISMFTLPLIDFDKNPWNLEAQKSILPLSILYDIYPKRDDSYELTNSDFLISYDPNNEEEKTIKLSHSFTKLMPFVFELFERSTSFEDLYILGKKMRMSFYDDVLLQNNKTEGIYEKIIEEMKNQIEECRLTKYVNMPERQENYINKLQLAFNNRIKWLKDRDKGGELHEEYMKEINININQNIAKLTNVGYYEQEK